MWWQLHETLTRNHRCESLAELLDNVYDWADRQQNFAPQTVYFQNVYPFTAKRYVAAEDLFSIR